MDYISVKDVGRAMALLVGSNFHGGVNVGSGKATSVAEIANVILRLLGKPEQAFPTREPPVRAKSEDLYADTTRLHGALGFLCSVGLEEGVSEMIAATSN